MFGRPGFVFHSLVLYSKHDVVQESFAVTSELLERDPYALEAMPVHLVAALELGKKNELFLKAHKCVCSPLSSFWKTPTHFRSFLK